MLDPRDYVRWHCCVRRPTHVPFWSMLLFSLALGASPANAVERSCGSDPVQNTTDVLCAPPSGPCTATTVTMSTGVTVPDGTRCSFDLGGRVLVVERTLEVTGADAQLAGAISVFNASEIVVTKSGKLKARGDFVQPQGFIVGGGVIELASAGSVWIDGVLDATGDPAGAITVLAGGDLGIGAAAILRGNGLGSFLDEGERFADGAKATLESRTGSVRIYGEVGLSGQSLGAGGELNVLAARDVVVAHKVTMTGSDGGEIAIFAGGDVRVTRAIDVDGTGDGNGGVIEIESGIDPYTSTVTEGDTIMEDLTITMNGAGRDDFGTEAGELCLLAAGDIIWRNVVVRGDAIPGLDGGGGTVVLDSQCVFAVPILPCDGRIEIDGHVSLRSGRDGFSGTFDAAAGTDLIQRTAIDARGESGGDVNLFAKGSILVEGMIDIGHPAGDGGVGVFMEAGEASQGTLTLGADVLAVGGPDADPDLDLRACKLIVAPGVKIDARTGSRHFTLGSLAPMELGAGARFLAGPRDDIELVYPPGADPVVGADVVFDPLRVDSNDVERRLPACPPPGCGNGIVESPERCDDGNFRNGDGCTDQCQPSCTRHPRTDCRGPAVGGRATLEIRHDGQPARDRLIWRWLKGSATTHEDFGAPTDGDDYALCIYETATHNLSRLFGAVAPAGELCGNRPCWKSTATGYVYDDPDRTPSGIDRLELIRGAHGDAKITAVAKGIHAALPTLPLRVPAVVQLQGSHGECWEARYSTAERNTDTRLEATAD